MIDIEKHLLAAADADGWIWLAETDILDRFDERDVKQVVAAMIAAGRLLPDDPVESAGLPFASLIFRVRDRLDLAPVERSPSTACTKGP